jgi:F-type H+-transporting ATPase subunit a
MAGHQVIWVALMLAPLGAPALFFGLEFIVSFLQAFIFSLLTMVYIGLALDEPH